MNDLYGPLDEKRKKRKKAGTESSKESSLRDWFGRKGAKGKKKGWVDCNAPDGKGGYKSCGRSKGEKRKKYPACRPTPGACKERGKGKSWGKKAKSKKSRKNEGISMEFEQIILEELEAVLDEKKKRKKKKKKSSGKKDACYHKVKSRYKVWPSAYASGALVKCRKVGAKNWGNSKKESLEIMIEDELSQVLAESHSKEHEEELKTIVGELEKASEMHASQAERIQQILDETDDDKLEEEKDLYEMKNCGCGQDPCETYGDENEKIMIAIKEETESIIFEKKKKKKKKSAKDRMKCNSPRRIRKGEAGHGKKKFVVKACDGGTEKIIRYGDAKMEIKRDSPARRKSFRARHNCKNPGSKLKARYWSCKKW